MSKHADAPLCKNPHCQEDRHDMVSTFKYLTYWEHYCHTCSKSWTEPREQDKKAG
jgi:hypothetical protein